MSRKFKTSNFSILLLVTLFIASCGGSSSQSVGGEVPPSINPTTEVRVEILHPQTGVLAKKGVITVSGEAEGASSILAFLDSESQINVTASNSWSFDLNTSTLPLGLHTLRVTASHQGQTVSDSIIIEVIGPDVDLGRHVGSLYRQFDWAGAVRDPLNRELEVRDGASYSPLATERMDDLRLLLEDGEVIAQIGGMGSAKLNHDVPGTVNAAFSDYMDNILADGGASWRQAVSERVSEVAAAVERDDRFYWQIGNEISALSYSSNIHFYLMDGKQARAYDEDIIPIYVEWFFAPTVQEIQNVSDVSKQPVKVALGSITGFSTPQAREFLDALLNYQIEGEYAPALAGRKVYEFVDLITVHYMMSGGEPLETEYWRDILKGVQEDWFGIGRIEGVWNTEEIGIRAAEDGRGAAGALTIAARYLGWVGENQYFPHEAKWFYYGANTGPTGQRATDSMAALFEFVETRPVNHALTSFSQDPAVETQFYRVPDNESAFAVITNLSESSIILEESPSLLPASTPLREMIDAKLYTAEASSTISAFARTEDSMTRVVFNTPVTLGAKDSILLLFPG